MSEVEVRRGPVPSNSFGGDHASLNKSRWMWRTSFLPVKAVL